MILITRPKAQSINLNSKLKSRGYNTFQESFYNIKYLKKKVSYEPYVYYIFASIHSVKSLKKNKQIFKFKDAKIIAVGKQVKKILKDFGCKNLIITAPDSSSLLEVICSPDYKKKCFTYFCSNFVNEDFFVDANKKKLKIKKSIVYKTQGTKTWTKKLINYFRINKITGVTLYSQLSVRIFLSLLTKYQILNVTKHIHIYCISERVAKPLKKSHFGNIHIAKHPNEQSLIGTVKKTHFNKN